MDYLIASELSPTGKDRAFSRCCAVPLPNTATFFHTLPDGDAQNQKKFIK